MFGKSYFNNEEKKISVFKNKFIYCRKILKCEKDNR